MPIWCSELGSPQQSPSKYTDLSIQRSIDLFEEGVFHWHPPQMDQWIGGSLDRSMYLAFLSRGDERGDAVDAEDATAAWRGARRDVDGPDKLDPIALENA